MCFDVDLILTSLLIVAVIYFTTIMWFVFKTLFHNINNGHTKHRAAIWFSNIILNMANFSCIGVAAFEMLQKSKTV